MTLTEYTKLGEKDKRKYWTQYFYNCKRASVCKIRGSILCMNNCKDRELFIDKEKKED